MPSFPSRRAALIALAFFAVVAPAFAEPTAEENDYVAKAVAYLDGLSSVKGHFTQTDENGGVAGGELYLSRPGKARFQYDPPSPLLITSDGKTVILTNSRLKNFQRVALSSTPLAIFLADHIRLDRGVRVTRVDLAPGGFSITARGAHAADGEIVLYFTDPPMRLTGWAATDAQGHVIRVALDSLTPTAPPPDDFFTQTRR